MRWSEEDLMQVGVSLDEEIKTELQKERLEERSHFLVSVLIAFGAWLGGIFLLGFIGALFAHTFNLDEGGLIAVGFCVMIGAISLHRNAQGVFAQHFALSLSIGGHLAFYGGIGWSASSLWAPALISLPVTVVHYLVYRKQDHRFLSVLCSSIILVMACRIENLPWGIFLLMVTQVSLSSVVMLKFWHRNDLRPLASALLLSSIVGVITMHQGFFWLRSVPEYFGHLVTLPMAGIWLAIVFWIGDRQIRLLLLGALALLSLSFVILGSPGIPLALIFLVAGRLRSPWITWIGVMGLGVAIVETYHNMDRTLLYKSMSMFGVSVALAVLAYIFSREASSVEDSKMGTRELSGIKFSWVRFVGLLWIIGGLLFSIHGKEKTLENGRAVFLELAPRDPRSLMQGDYMVLNYQIIRNNRRKDIPLDGNMVLKVDERGVGTFLRWDDGTEVEESEMLLRYRKRRGGVKLGAESFFFEEGKGKSFEEAKYSRLRVTESGDSVLVSLHNAEFKKIQGVKDLK